MAEKDVRKIAAVVLTPDQIDNLMSIIKSWRKKNPKMTFFPPIRFSDFAAERRKSKLTKAEVQKGLFNSIEAATERADEMRLQVERGLYLATRMPQLSGMYAELWLTRLIKSPYAAEVLADISTLSEAADRIAVTTEKLPDQIAAERRATIKQLMREISNERKAVLEDTRVEITKAIERAEREGEKLVDHSMHQAIILIVIGLIGYVLPEFCT
jgi:hypothetical protein